jgi:hypothetical protein
MILAPLRLLAGAAIAALVAGTLLTAPTAAAAQPSQPSDTAARANYQVPKVGACHRLSMKQASAQSDGRAPVSCDSKHTTRTLAVKRLTGTVNWNDRSALYPKLQRKCWNALERELGSSDQVRSQTAYTWFWFTPTPAQIERGAKWLRCDLVLYGVTKLMPLGAGPAIPSAQLPDRIRKCLVPQGWMTVCARPHAYRSVGAFRITGGYPSDQRAHTLALQRCDRFVTAGRAFAWTYPTRDEWAAGSRAMVCYNKTTR